MHGIFIEYIMTDSEECRRCIIAHFCVKRLESFSFLGRKNQVDFQSDWILFEISEFYQQFVFCGVIKRFVLVLIDRNEYLISLYSIVNRRNNVKTRHIDSTCMLLYDKNWKRSQTSHLIQTLTDVHIYTRKIHEKKNFHSLSAC